MGNPVIPTTLPAGWQTEYKPHEWLEALQVARQILHEETLRGVVPGAPSVNPRLEEAKQTIAMANDALSVYDEAEAQGGLNPFDPSSRMHSGIVGGMKGEGNLAKNLALAIPRAIAGTWNLLTQPEPTIDRWSQGIDALGNQLSEFMYHPIRTAENASPESVGEFASSLAATALPGARMSTAIGRTRPLGAGMEGPLDALTSRVMANSTVLDAALAPFKRIRSSVGSWMRKPEYQNAEAMAKAKWAEESANLAQTSNANAIRQGEMAEQLFPERLQQAQLKTQIIGEQYGRQAAMADQLQRKIDLLEQQLQRGGPTLDNLNLKNQIDELRRQLLEIKLANAQGGGPMPSGPSGPSPSMPPSSPAGGPFGPTGAPPSPTVGPNAGGNPPPAGPTPTGSTIPQFETHGPGGAGLPPVKPSRFIGPSASIEDIDRYLRQILRAQQEGYK